MKPFLLILSCVLLPWLGTLRGGTPLILSEFMANNTRTVTDEDGAFSDWIEIYNGGKETVNLLNWSLTDSAKNLTQWRFPATNLPPGRFLLTFASGKNRRSPGSALHTNFRLADSGEFLALVAPDGLSIATQFNPSFPPQSPDVSYGLAAHGTLSTLVPLGAEARAWVPRDASLGSTWLDPDFNDAGWIHGTTGVGYERSSGYASLLGLNLLSSSLPEGLRLDANGDGINENNSVYVRIPFLLPASSTFNTLRLRMRHDDGFAAYLNGRRVAADNEPADLEWNARAASDYGDATDVMIAITYGPGNQITLYRNGQIYADPSRASTGTLQTYPARIADVLIGKRHEDLAEGGTATGVDGFLAASVNEARIYGAPLTASGISNLFHLGPVSGAEPPQVSPTYPLLHLWSFNDGTARDLVGQANGTLLNGARIEQGRLELDGINDYMRSARIGTNISTRTLVVWVSLANLNQQAGSALTLENPTGGDIFDGIVFAERIPGQWMNGSSFFERSVANNGGAAETLIEGGTSTSSFISFDLSENSDTLRTGTNILALHGFNFGLEDSDMLLMPELIGGAFDIEAGETGYFSSPTPGAMNGAAFQKVFATLGFSRERGIVSQPFSLSITSDVPSVEIRYTLDGAVPRRENSLAYSSPLTISHNTLVRAAGFRPGFSPTEPVTHTYLFLDDVLRQTNSAPEGAHWDTEMDPQIVDNSFQTWTVPQGLADLPVLSIVMENKDLFGPNGIYPNAASRGDEWERGASVEYFYPEEYRGDREGKGFAINAGIQINGNFSRLTHQPKHSFRLVFKQAWGPARLSFPLFAGYSVTEFDTLLVGCGHNQGWSTGIENSQFLRNRFAWDLEGAEPGRAYVHSRTVHVYLNGLYWGLYDLGERPDESFSASNFGGAKEDYDVFKGLQAGGSTQARNINGLRDAWSQLFAAADRALTQASNYAEVERWIDMDPFIDYSIGILYTADRDGPTGWLNGEPNSLEPKNFYASRHRSPEGKFRFWRWDSEFTLEGEGEDVSERDGFENPGHLHFRLRTSPEYRLRFADRVQRLFFNGGPYTTNALMVRYASLAEEIEKAVVAESARWGDAKKEPPFRRDTEWVAERDRIMKTYFPRRFSNFMSQLRADKLFPTFSAPGLAIDGAPQSGGPIRMGGLLTLTATNGTIYFTLDGTDPRLPGGAVAAGAEPYALPLPLKDTVEVKARVLSNGQWSALTAATFSVPEDGFGLSVTEIMYHPPDQGTVAGEELEFLELQNTGDVTLALEGLEFTSGIRYRFPQGSLLAPSQFLVLGRNSAALQATYPGLRVQGTYSGSLANEGERLRLERPSGAAVFDLTFDRSSPWPRTSAGMGFSLVRRESRGGPSPNLSTAWRASSNPGGSPGKQDPLNPVPRIQVNEALANPAPPTQDSVELFNPSAEGVDLGGWFLTDNEALPRKYRIPAGTVIPGSGYLVLTETDFNHSGTTNDFALSSRGESIHLFSANEAGQLTGHDHGFRFGASSPGISFGRHLNSTGDEHFVAQTASTLGEPNGDPRIGPVVITEIHFHPPPGEQEFVELLNITATLVPLYDPERPSNTWHLSGVDYLFPAGLSLKAGERMILVSGDPAAFRARYGLSTELRVLGPFLGGLQNNGERLELIKPGVPDTNGPASITVDAVRYDSRRPWPEGASSTGASLQRLAPTLYGDDPAHWTVAAPNPGTDAPAGSAPSLLSQPSSLEVATDDEALFTVSAQGSSPLRYQWRLDGVALPGANQESLRLSSLRPNDGGAYSVVVFNPHGTVLSSNAHLIVRTGPLILLHPTFRTVTSGGSATFSVLASGRGFLRYQWQYNGQALPAQTNATLSLTRLLPSQGGSYQAVVTDEIGSSISRPATLTVPVRPTLVTQPQGLTVLEGGTAVFAVQTSGSLPMTYTWRKNNAPIANQVLQSLTANYGIGQVQRSDAGRYTVSVSNLGGSAPTSATATLTVLADFDRDGMADLWEAAYGFDTNSVADARRDGDGDRMINEHEYIAGTDPTQASSVLQLNQPLAGNPLVLTFQAVSNRSYTVQYRENLEMGSWETLGTVGARPTNRLERVTDPGSPHGRFYRLLIP